MVAIAIFTSRRYEDISPSDRIIQVPHITKKDYLIVQIDRDGYITLLDEVTCKIRSDMKLNKESDVIRRLLDKHKNGNGQIKVTVLKALGEEQIIAFKDIA